MRGKHLLLRKNPMAEGNTIRLKAGGKRAPDTMAPGNYNAVCVSGEIKQRGKALQAILGFKVRGDAQAEDGVLLQKWFNITLRPDGGVSPASVYFQACQLALGRPVQPEEELDPNEVFVGKSFKVTVGYRSTSIDNSYAPSNTTHRKDPRDFLRIHELVEQVSQPYKKPISHMNSMTPYEVTYNVGGGGGGGGDTNITPTPTPPPPPAPIESGSPNAVVKGNGTGDVRHDHAPDGRDNWTGEAVAAWRKAGHEKQQQPEQMAAHEASLRRWKAGS